MKVSFRDSSNIHIFTIVLYSKRFLQKYNVLWKKDWFIILLEWQKCESSQLHSKLIKYLLLQFLYNYLTKRRWQNFLLITEHCFKKKCPYWLNFFFKDLLIKYICWYQLIVKALTFLEWKTTSPYNIDGLILSTTCNCMVF